jgi:hypothetical protein
MSLARGHNFAISLDGFGTGEAAGGVASSEQLDHREDEMQPSEITEVLNRPISQELLARDLTRLAYVAKDGTPRTIPIGFVWNGSEIAMCTATNAPGSPPYATTRRSLRSWSGSGTNVSAPDRHERIPLTGGYVGREPTRRGVLRVAG